MSRIEFIVFAEREQLFQAVFQRKITARGQIAPAVTAAKKRVARKQTIADFITAAARRMPRRCDHAHLHAAQFYFLPFA